MSFHSIPLRFLFGMPILLVCVCLCSTSQSLHAQAFRNPQGSVFREPAYQGCGCQSCLSGKLCELGRQHTIFQDRGPGPCMVDGRCCPNLEYWGYTQQKWSRPFEKQTGAETSQQRKIQLKQYETPPPGKEDQRIVTPQPLVPIEPKKEPEQPEGENLESDALGTPMSQQTPSTNRSTRLAYPRNAQPRMQAAKVNQGPPQLPAAMMVAKAPKRQEASARDERSNGVGENRTNPSAQNQPQLVQPEFPKAPVEQKAQAGKTDSTNESVNTNDPPALPASLLIIRETHLEEIDARVKELAVSAPRENHVARLPMTQSLPNQRTNTGVRQASAVVVADAEEDFAPPAIPQGVIQAVYDEE